MKTKFLLLFFAVTYTLLANATTSLRVQDPRQNWRQYQGTIDSAVISITPKGAYFECGLYLTFSSRPNVNNYDTFEVQLYFDLPEGSIMHDSWLWVGNQIIQARLIDRVKATLTYEGIVQRRQDPSILYKNSPTQYELRVFPMAANQTRKVKLTYLVPAVWRGGTAQCPLPLNIPKASRYVPSLRVLSYDDSVWRSPDIPEVTNEVFQSTPYGFRQTTIQSSLISSSSAMTYKLTSPMQNGVYAGKYETSPGAGFYQVVIDPKQALSTNISKKAALLFDYEPGLSNTTPYEVLAKARQMLHEYFADNDSFNLIFSRLTMYRASEVWLPCDSATIENTFSSLNPSNPISYYSNLPSLIADGVDFLKTNGNSGELILISNSDNQQTPSIANQLITDIQALMSPYRFPVNVLDYTETDYTTNYIGNTYYTGNEYFYKNLSALTGGTYERSLFSYYSYYYYQARPFAEVATELFESLDGRITSFDVYPISPTGFCYGKYNSITTGIVPLNRSFIQIGKYTGSAPAQVQVTGIFNAVPFSQIVDISQSTTEDEMTKKMWVGNYIQMLENSSPDDQTQAEVADSSIRNRVLSLYTAFLALEPSDTTQACTTCEDETMPTVGLEDIAEDSVAITAMPNPFGSEVRIQVQVSGDVKEASLQIFNVMGQLVKTVSMDDAQGTDFSFTWNGADEKGENVSAGIYIVVLATPESRHTLKLVKS